jgi:hypothetical protein
MPQDRIRRKIGHAPFMRVAFGAALAACVAGASTAARAGDDSDSSFMDKFMHTLGLRSPADESGITYSERSPLVVPPTRDLPPPAVGGPPQSPNWPKDPDMKRRAEAKAKASNKGPYIDNALESDRVLRPDELDKPGRPSPSATNTQQGQSNTADPPPKKSIFSFDWMKKEEYATFTGEPARTSLTDPPPGYLTPSPDQPYGVAPEKKAAKQQTLGERMEIQR